MENLLEFDRQLFLFLNSLHFPWLDQLMYYISTEWLWIPLYMFFIGLIIKKKKKQAWLPILVIFLAVLLSDQISGQIKKATKRPRPSHDVELLDKVHIVNNYRGGSFGFVSSHAANTFCVAFFLSTFLRLSCLSTIILFGWAFIVSYSRLYLGVHFPLDLLCGAILGMIIGILMFLLEKKGEKLAFSQTPFP